MLQSLPGNFVILILLLTYIKIFFSNCLNKTSFIILFKTVTFRFCRDEYDSEGSEASDDEARPLTRNELQNKVMKTVRKRESAAKKDGFKYDLSNAREMQKNKKDKK